jgi:hypothetical protein
MFDLRTIARALGGNIVGGQVLAPGPGHSRADRSLAVRPSAQSQFGFVAHSHADDDWQSCRNYVLEKLDLPRHDELGRELKHDRRQPGTIASLTIMNNSNGRRPRGFGVSGGRSQAPSPKPICARRVAIQD